MPARKAIPDDLKQLLPLTPAVFFILLSLVEDEKHGYVIMQEVSQLSGGEFRMGPGTLYTTIQRLLELGLIVEAQVGGGDPRRRYYKLTGNGRAVLEAEVGRMESVVRLARKRKLLPRTAE